MKKIEYWLGVDILFERLGELEHRLYELETGVMHDDYPKCKHPEGSAWSMCKHGRAEFNSCNLPTLPEELQILSKLECN